MDDNQLKTKENIHNNKRKLKITYNIAVVVIVIDTGILYSQMLDSLTCGHQLNPH